MRSIVSGSKGQAVEDSENYAGIRQVHWQIPLTTSMTWAGTGSTGGRPMSQQLSYPRPWSPIPGSESLWPLTWEEGGAPAC